MRILILGSGGREHALAWRLQRDPQVSAVLCAPGNPGLAGHVPTAAVTPTRPDEVLALIEAHGIDLTVVGPEAPLAAGLVDRCLEAGHPVFGPTAAAARLETSKAFAKAFMERHHVPTARHVTCHTADQALEVIRSGRLGPSVVVKADGLAAGKGVVVAPDQATAEAAVHAAMVDAAFGDAGRCVVLEECLSGPEVSCFVVADGGTFRWLLTAQDHKRIYDHDEGPNTGGMGAYCPAPFVDDKLLAEIEARILVPTVHAMRRAKVPFQGVLFGGLMLTAQGPKVLEFNARFGDPECEALMARLDSSLLELLDATADRRLDEVEPPRWRAGASVTVVMAAEGYPGAVEKGRPIRGLEAAAGVEGVHVFHAATQSTAAGIVTDGGRVLAVTATAPTLARAKLQAYTGVKEIRWPGAWCRKDIADKGLHRERELAAVAVEEPA